MQVGGGALARTLVGGSGDVADAAAQWLRIAALGAPGLLLAAAGNGWLRGIQDTRRPLLFVLAPNLLSALLCPLLVYPGRARPGRFGGGQRRSRRPSPAASSRRRWSRERVSLRPRPRADPAAARAQPGPADPGRRLPGELPLRHRRRRPVRRRRRRRPPDRPAALVLHRPGAGRPGHRRPVPGRRRARRRRRGRRPRPGPADRAARRRLRRRLRGADRRRRRRRAVLVQLRSAGTRAGHGGLAVVRRRCSRSAGWCSPSTAC